MTIKKNWQTFSLPNADVCLLPDFLDSATASAAFVRLHSEIAWEYHRVRLFGRELNAPRLSCWVGDTGTRYSYSRTSYEPRAWTPTLTYLRAQIAAICDAEFNSVLCNLYRDGHDSMGWHSDDESELGPTPIIASLSLGGVRRFRLCHQHDATLHMTLDLPSGSLLLMRAATQRHYRHALPKTSRYVLPRINLTFRHIIHSGQVASI